MWRAQIGTNLSFGGRMTVEQLSPQVCGTGQQQCNSTMQSGKQYFPQILSHVDCSSFFPILSDRTCPTLQVHLGQGQIIKMMARDAG